MILPLDYKKPLLTIAIPTWNRADKLQDALSHILPQVTSYLHLIEILVSDNASTDNTIEVIKKFKNNYPTLNFEYYTQLENTGFYGNFYKCISLGTGEYLWLLSDDDFVFDGVVKILIDVLVNHKPGAVFLSNWTDDKFAKQQFYFEQVTKNKFFSNKPYRHSLISSVIFKNSITIDDNIFKLLKNNSLLGYAVFLKAIYNYENFFILYGNSLAVNNDKANVTYNALRAFTIDLAACLEIVKPLYPKTIVNKIANSFLATNIFKHYKCYKFKNSFRNYEGNDTLWIFKDFVIYKVFWTKIIFLILLPKIFCKFTYFIYEKFFKINQTL